MGSRSLLGIILVFVTILPSAFASWSDPEFDRDPQRSHDLSQMLQKAERGDTHAQFAAGLAYEAGVGVEQDYAEAARWYRKAANSGHSGAKIVLRPNARLDPALRSGFRRAAQLLACPEQLSGAKLSNGPRKRLKFDV